MLWAFDGGRLTHSVSRRLHKPRTRRARMVEQSSTHFCLNWRKSGWTRWIRPALLGRKTSQVQANVSEMADRLKVDLQKRLCKFRAVAKNHVELGWGSIGMTSKRNSDVHREWRQADRPTPGSVPRHEAALACIEGRLPWQPWPVVPQHLRTRLEHTFRIADWRGSRTC